jgi:TRAP-type uncharacterized transport system substrate-binding protein
MEITTEIIISLSFLIIGFVYIWFDYRHTMNNQLEEGFEYQAVSSILPPQKFTHYQYIDTSDPAVVQRNADEYPILRFSLFDSNTYDVELYQYFRHKIYPCESVSTASNMQTLLQFQRNECDIAFVSEEQALRYHTGDCRLFNKEWSDAFPGVARQPNCSAIGIAYYEYMYVITRNNNKKNVLDDVIKDRIGICGDDYYYFTKLLSMLDFEISNLRLTMTTQTNELIQKFNNNEIDVIFVVSHPKNRDLLDLSRNQQIKFIKYVNDEIRMKQHQYLASAIIITEDLNRFYRYGNIFKNSAYEVISIRTVLMVRNGIITKAIEFLVRNYIASLIKMRESIDRKNYSRQLNNFNIRDFNYEELVSMNVGIPLNPIANAIYKEEGLVVEEQILQCKY